MMNYKILIAIKNCFIHLLRAVFLVILILIVLALYPILVEPNMLIVKHKNLYLPNWSPAHNGLKVAVISDIHLSKYCIDTKKLQKIVDKTNKENPDIIFYLGDLDSYLIQRYKFDKKEIAKILSELNAKYGVVAVLGNHDYNRSVVKNILLDSEITLLEDEKIIKYINLKPLIIYGLKDMWHYNPQPGKIIKDKDRGNSIILLSHNPDVFPQVPNYVSLTLSGHTHGGQVLLPFLGGIFTPSIYEQRYNKGYIVENNKHLFVTSGLGFSVPLRFGNPPEIVILNLYSQDTYANKKIENTKPLKGLKHSLNYIGVTFATNLIDYFKLW